MGKSLRSGPSPIQTDDYIGDVIERVYAMTEEVVADAVRDLAAGTARWTPQANDLATYTRRRRPEDGRIRWTDSALESEIIVRAISHPFPGAFTYLTASAARVARRNSAWLSRTHRRGTRNVT